MIFGAIMDPPFWIFSDEVHVSSAYVSVGVFLCCVVLSMFLC